MLVGLSTCAGRSLNTCPLDGRRMFGRCSFSWSLDVRIVFLGCSIGVRWVATEVRLIFALCWVGLLGVLDRCWIDARWMLDSRSIDVLRMADVCSMDVQ